jgi:hypothetical protein
MDVSRVTLRGDSITALTWASEWRFYGDRVTNAAVVYVLQAMAMGAHVDGYSHLSSAENWRCDELSRGGTWSALQQKDPRWVGVDETALDVADLVALCDPRAGSWDLSSDLWQRAQAAAVRSDRETF